VGDIQKKAKKIQDDFRDNVDANPNAVYDSDFLEDYLSKGKANKKALDQRTREINAAIESSGSDRAEKLKPAAFNEHFDEWEKEVKKAKKKFDDFRLDNAKTWESLEERTKSFEIVIKGFAYSKQHGGATAYSGKTKSMLKTAIRNAKPVSEVEKESGIKKPKNMSQQKYKALVSRAEEAMAHAPKSVKGKKAKQLYKQYLASQLGEAKQKDWDKTVKAVNETANERGTELFVALQKNKNTKMDAVGVTGEALSKVSDVHETTLKSGVAAARYSGAGYTADLSMNSSYLSDIKAIKGIGEVSRTAGSLGKVLSGLGFAGKVLTVGTTTWEDTHGGHTAAYGLGHGATKLAVSSAAMTGAAAAIALIPGVNIAAAGIIATIGVGILASSVLDKVSDKLWNGAHKVKIVNEMVGD
ncbi:hypothetical protein, partial [Latilactobacillus graminis]